MLAASLKGARPARPEAYLLGIAVFACALACEQQPEDLRVWTPQDHDHTNEPGTGQVDTEADAGAAMPLPGIEHHVLIAWRNNCVRCHGQIGLGDGPQGAALKATNLADPLWQERTSDEQIKRSIIEGKGLMPKADLPEGTIDGLIKLIRLMAPKQADQKVETQDAEPAPAGRRRSEQASGPSPG